MLFDIFSIIVVAYILPTPYLSKIEKLTNIGTFLSFLGMILLLVYPFVNVTSMAFVGLYTILFILLWLVVRVKKYSIKGVKYIHLMLNIVMFVFVLKHGLPLFVIYTLLNIGYVGLDYKEK